MLEGVVSGNKIAFGIKVFQGFSGYHFQPFSKIIHKRQILDSSKLKEFADENFKFDDKGREFSKKVKNTVGKRGIARYEKFLLFPHCF